MQKEVVKECKELKVQKVHKVLKVPQTQLQGHLDPKDHKGSKEVRVLKDYKVTLELLVHRVYLVLLEISGLLE